MRPKSTEYAPANDDRELRRNIGGIVGGEPLGGTRRLSSPRIVGMANAGNATPRSGS